MKKKSIWFLLFVVIATIFTSCKKEDPAHTTGSENVQLWLITEASETDGINGVTEKLIDQFEETHEGFSIHMEVLPINEEERTVRLEQIRTQVMAGYGPDIYLLPSLFSDDMLFDDVAQAMRNGVFADISTFYDADAELCKETLESKVMDAGVVDSARYVLPIYYNIPLIYADPDYISEAGLALSEQGIDIFSFLDAVLDIEDPALATYSIPYANYARYDGSFSVQYEGFSLLSDAVDYNSGNVLLTNEEVSHLFKKYQNVNVLAGSGKRWDVTISNYIVYADAQTSPIGLAVGSLSRAMDYAAIAQSADREVVMIPLRAADGDLVANVTYYAAAGSGCDYPEEAYEFLRLFLKEETQWEENRIANEYREPGMILYGWPVRSKGAVEALWKNCYEAQIKMDVAYYLKGEKVDGSEERAKRLKQVNLDEDDLPVLNVPIDRARFQSTKIEKAFSEMLWSLNNYQANFEPSDIDISTLSEQLIQKLEMYVAEG